MSAPPPAVELWIDYASTYSFLAAERAEEAAAERGVALLWRPFLLGPIFKAQGWDTSPFALYPAKGRYMWRDLERRAAGLGLPALKTTEPFPQNSLLAARAGTALPEALRAAYSRAVYRAQFLEGRRIDDPATVAEAVREAGADPGAILAEAASEPVKAALREATETARARGLFGAPSLVTPDGELFWGEDRLDDALDWAAAGR